MNTTISQKRDAQGAGHRSCGGKGDGGSVCCDEVRGNDGNDDNDDDDNDDNDNDNDGCGDVVGGCGDGDSGGEGGGGGDGCSEFDGNSNNSGCRGDGYGPQWLR